MTEEGVKTGIFSPPSNVRLESKAAVITNSGPRPVEATELKRTNSARQIRRETGLAGPFRLTGDLIW
jgi:hypothetical protein